MMKRLNKMWLAMLVAVPAMAADSPKKAEPAKKAPAAVAKPVAAAKTQPKAAAAAVAVAPKKPAAAPAPAAGPALPAGAVEVQPGLFKHTASNGEVWMYRRTPFGYSRYQPEKEIKDADKEESQYLVATDQGEAVQFERKTPFGVNKWTRKKAELTGAERLALERAQQGGAANRAATGKASQE